MRGKPAADLVWKGWMAQLNLKLKLNTLPRVRFGRSAAEWVIFPQRKRATIAVTLFLPISFLTDEAPNIVRITKLPNIVRMSCDLCSIPSLLG